MTAIMGSEGMLTQDSSYEQYEKQRADIEKGFNILGYIPGLSSISGPARSGMGVVNLIQDMTSMIFYGISDLFKKPSLGYTYRPFKHVVYIIHDISNIARGLAEFFFFIGNIAMLVNDLAVGRLSYSVEATYRPKPFFYKFFYS
jgi:hypothetical protein